MVLALANYRLVLNVGKLLKLINELKQRTAALYFKLFGYQWAREHMQRNEQVNQTLKYDIEPELNEPPPTRASLASAHHRASGFNLSWQREHPWLVHSKEQGMFCTCVNSSTRSQEMEAGYGCPRGVRISAMTR